MRILHINCSPVVKGGRESHIRRFCELSIAMGHENALIDDAVLSSNMESSEVLALAYQQGLSETPDVILLHSRPSWAFAELMSKIAPTFVWEHSYEFVCPASISWFRNSREVCTLPPGIHCLANAYLKFCNARRPDRNLHNYLAVRQSLAGIPHLSGIIVASSYVKERLIIGGVPDDLIQVLPYFIVPPENIVIDYAQERPQRILFVGRFSEVKGVDVLLEALSQMPPNCELVIAGGGSDQTTLEEQARQLGLMDGRVTFAGYINGPEKMHALYQSASVVAVPSLWPEPFGIVGLEALLHGKPVVAFDVGGISEWLVDGGVGLLAKPGDVNDLAAKLLHLLSDSNYRQTLGRRGPDHVRQHFSWEKHWQKFSAILRERSVQV